MRGQIIDRPLIFLCTDTSFIHLPDPPLETCNFPRVYHIQHLPRAFPRTVYPLRFPITLSTMPHTTTYWTRAEQPNTHPLNTYLFNLISIKHSNLCVSADVHTSSALIKLAEEVGDSICVLKTHADIVDDFSEKTISRLIEVSRRKKFLLFEDRKFGDIGSVYARTQLSRRL